MLRIARAVGVAQFVTMDQISLDTPFGPLCLTAVDDALTRVTWGHAPSPTTTPVLTEAVRQLNAYLAGDLTAFDLPMVVAGHDLQKRGCAAMSDIPFGETVTYGDIAKALGVSAQAVGQACGRNPIPIIIPCHRVMGAKGLTGFSGEGGVETKLALLKHEGAGGFLI